MCTEHFHISPWFWEYKIPGRCSAVTLSAVERQDCQLLTGTRWKPSQFLLGSANSGFLALHMSIMAGRALNDLENRFLTKMCLLNSSVVWVPRFTSPHYSFPLGDTRDPTILGLQLQDCMNIIHIPNSPSAVTKPESKSFVNMNWKLAFLSYIVVFTQIYLYMCPYICIHLYELSYENIFHHLIRLDSQQLPGCKNLSFFKASEGGNNSNTSLFIGNKNNFDSVFQCSKKLDKAEILCLSNSKC